MTSSIKLSFYITSRILGLGVFISATVWGNFFDIVDNLIKFSPLDGVFSTGPMGSNFYFEPNLLFISTLFLRSSTLDRYLLSPLLWGICFSLLIDLFILLSLVWEFFKSLTTAISFYWIIFSKRLCLSSPTSRIFDTLFFSPEDLINLFDDTMDYLL